MKYEKGTISTSIDIIFPISLIVVFMITVWMNNIYSQRMRDTYAYDIMLAMDIIISNIRDSDDFYRSMNMIAENVDEIPDRVVYLHTPETGFNVIAGWSYLSENIYDLIVSDHINNYISGYIVKTFDGVRYNVYWHWVYLEDRPLRYLILLVMSDHAFRLEIINIIMYMSAALSLGYLLKINFIDRSIYTSIYIYNRRQYIRDRSK